MKDSEIIALFQERDEKAIKEVTSKYSNYCRSISRNILNSHEDVEECVNDTYLRVWDAIPPAVPKSLAVYMGTITRRLSLNKYKKNKALKRSGEKVALALDELNEVIEDPASDIGRVSESETITKSINDFLEGLPERERNVFVRRYWHLYSIDQIAQDYNLSASNTKQILFRTRKKLKTQLEKDGIVL